MSEIPRTGWVYVLENPSMPDQVKVGFTKSRPEERAAVLGSTGVPTPFRVATAFLFADKVRFIEQATHKLLEKDRVSQNREFFNCTPTKAAYAIIQAAEKLGVVAALTEPVLISDEELRELQAIEEKKWQQEEELEKLNQPCKRVNWVEPYSPYREIYESSSVVFGSFIASINMKNYTKLIWKFTDCECLYCKKNRTIRYSNPSDLDRFYETVSEVIARNASIGLMPLRSSWESVQDYVHNWAMEVCLGGYPQWEKYDKGERALFMKRHRAMAHDTDMLSAAEKKLVDSEIAPAKGIYGVWWKLDGGGWRCSYRTCALWAYEDFKDDIFNCKESAVAHFNKKHKSDGDHIFISELPCPCNRCKPKYVAEQKRRNRTLNR